MKFSEFTALELGAKIKAGECSVLELLQETQKVIGEKDGEINAFITPPMDDSFVKQAEEIQKKIDNGTLTSPLAGVPMGIKDNICTKGTKTTCASKMLANFVPPYNATVIDRLEEAGVLLAGKCNMDEFAMGASSETSYFGPVKNPWNTAHTPGGSSGGSAAAVASGMVSVSLGSDTGGSVRQPAAFCGVTGFKPTYGLVSRYGAVAYASSLDQIGTVAKDVADTAAILDIIAGHDPLDATSIKEKQPGFLQNLNGDVAGKRIALPLSAYEKLATAEVKAAILETGKVLESQGAIVEQVDIACFDYAIHLYHIIANAEGSSNLARYDGIKYGHRTENPGNLEALYKKSRTEAFGSEVVKRAMFGTLVLSSDYYDAYYKKALQVKRLLVDELNDIFAKFDGMLLPVSPHTAPLLGDKESEYMADTYTVVANLAGLPALSIPAGFDQKGMPIGVQLIGKRLDDQTVLNLGHAFQKQTNYHRQTPSGKGGL